MNRVILVGVDGGSWPALHPLIDAGQLPTLARLVECGISGKLDCGAQAGVTLWASVATGMPVARHGVATAHELRADGGGVQPAGAQSWHVAPLWDILQAEGIPALVVGWPGTADATAWMATVVDERYAHADASLERDWPLAPRCVHPASLRDALADLRVHPEDLDANALRAAPAPALAHAASMHAAATALIVSETWQCLAVHYGPLLAAGGVGAAMLFDAMLARLLVLAGPQTDLLVVGSAGMLAGAGPGFTADVLLHGARIGDVAATVLARFGLQQEGAAGKVLDGTLAHPLRTHLAPARHIEDKAQSNAQLAHERLLSMAMSAMADGDFQAAATLLEPALRAQPDDTGIAFLLGQCRFFTGDSHGALALGHFLASAWTGQPWGPMLVGAALMQGGDAVAARPHLDLAATLGASDPAVALRLGAIALHLGRVDEAAQHYGVALGSAQLAADARAGLGLARLAQGDLAAGEAHLRASLGLRYHAPALHHQLGVLYASQRRWEMAAQALRTSLTQRPGMADVAALLAQITAEMARR